jgi:hypothetical protein
MDRDWRDPRGGPAALDKISGLVGCDRGDLEDWAAAFARDHPGAHGKCGGGQFVSLAHQITRRGAHCLTSTDLRAATEHFCGTFARAGGLVDGGAITAENLVSLVLRPLLREQQKAAGEKPGAIARQSPVGPPGKAEGMVAEGQQADEAAHLIVELYEAPQEDCGADCDLNLREPAALGLVACIDAILGAPGACGVEHVMQSYGLDQGQIGRIATFFSADG